jgi:hypothetical protein
LQYNPIIGKDSKKEKEQGARAMKNRTGIRL